MFFEDLKYLWLLAFALIPLIIHLINRGNRSIVNVGSLDWLTQKQFKQSKRLQFQQFTLLILRTVIFLLISFIVIKPFLLNNKKVDNKHLLLVKEDVSKQVLTNVMDTITLDEWNVKWLNWDLNDVNLKLKNTINTKAIHPFKAFELVEYKNINPLSVTIVGSFNQHQLKFKFPDVSFPVNWLLLPFENENRISEVGLVKRDGKNEILEIDQNEFLSKVIFYEKEDSNLDLPVINFNIDTIVVAFDKKKYEPLVKVLDAALKAVIEYQEMSTTILNQKADELTIDLKANLLFWLSDSTIDDSKIKSLQNTYVYKEELNKYSYVKVSDKVTYFNFDESENKIPGLLNEMLFENKAIAKKYNEILNQPINSTFFNSSKNEAEANSTTYFNDKINLNNYIVFILLFLIIIERLICWLSD